MSVQSFLHSVGEALMPTLTSSQFREKGVLTPEEFVAAGDLLVYKCPTWQWEAGDPKLRRSALPANKQYLVTRNVPCRRRVVQVEYTGEAEHEVDGEDGWLATHDDHVAEDDDDAPDIGGLSFADGNDGTEQADEAAGDSNKDAAAETVDNDGDDDNDDDDDDAPDIADLEEDNLMVIDAATLEAAPEKPGDGAEDAIVRTRTYDISITYDKYYQTPRVSLFGYGEHGEPLTPQQMFQDISQDHAKKTVTIENHPHLGIPHASIHPCRHGAVMKRIMDHLADGGKQELRVDQYLFLFLKFISSVIPTIEYDYTVEMNA